MSARFYPLTIKDVRRETKDCVSIAFDVPPPLREVFAFTAGQYVNLRAVIDGQALRRSYSLCSTPHSNEWRVAVKRVEGGRFSEFANTQLKVGDVIEVMPPDGKFLFYPEPETKRHLLAIAAGSGITPILSIITSLLEHEPRSRATLIYGNRRVRDIVFKEALEDLRDRFLSRFQLVHILSQEPQESPALMGRIDRKKLISICKELNANALINKAFVCGPIGLIDEVATTLCGEYGLPNEALSRELFAAPVRGTVSVADKRAEPAPDDAPKAHVTVIADGVERRLRVPFSGQNILTAALDAGIDAPFACTAGVCCTCRARVLEGEVRMDANFTLETHEVKRGFVLTCQAHPVSEKVIISYDAR